jgi:hypothetical protein
MEDLNYDHPFYHPEQHLKDKNGVPIWNPVMAEKHLKGKSADKILSAFQNALTPADYNQLSITGKYLNGNKSSEQLFQDVENNYSVKQSIIMNYKVPTCLDTS